jgi:hypothetical protein
MRAAVRATLTLAFLFVGGAALAQVPPPPADTEVKAEKPVVLWEQIVPILPGSRLADVGFTNVGLNMVNPVEMVWAIDRDKSELVAIATKPIAGTATAGEVMGNRGGGQLHGPVALAIATSGSFVCQDNGQLTMLRSGWTDSLDLRPVTGPECAARCRRPVSSTCSGSEVCVRRSISHCGLHRRVCAGRSLVASAGGTVFAAGRGKLALPPELDATGI